MEPGDAAPASRFERRWGAFSFVGQSGGRNAGTVRIDPILADISITPDDLKRLVRLVEESGLSELRYEQGDLRVTLRTAAFRPAASAAPVLVPASATGAVAAIEAHDEDADEHEGDEPSASVSSSTGVLRIEAPIMGVFYRKPAPDDPPFVEIGDVIEPGHVIGTIEAMKVFSEVPAEIGGRVVDIPAKHGGLVQPGDALVILEAVG